MPVKRPGTNDKHLAAGVMTSRICKSHDYYPPNFRRLDLVAASSTYSRGDPGLDDQDVNTAVDCMTTLARFIVE
jgi:hypothetical protein